MNPERIQKSRIYYPAALIFGLVAAALSPMSSANAAQPSSVTSSAFATYPGTTTVTITATGGAFDTSAAKKDFTFTGTDRTHLGNGTFTYVSPTVVTISGLTSMTGGVDNAVTVKGSGQSIQITSIVAVDLSSYSVTYNNGSATTAQTGGDTTYTTGSSFALPTGAPLKTGYTFAGWFLEPSGGSVLGTSYTPSAPFGAITIYAHWAHSSYSYSITYDHGTGTGTMNTQTGSATSVTLSSNTFTKIGYTFAGWKDVSEVSYADAQVIDLLAPLSITLTAQWLGNTYTVTYNNNGGSGSHAVGNYTSGGAPLVLADGTGFTRAGYVFGGWTTTVNDPTTIITTYATSANQTVYLLWIGVPTVTTFTPTIGGNGSHVVITGTNFFGASAVKFGGTDAASFRVDSPVQITALVGTGATGAVSVTTSAGTGTSAGTFTWTLVPLVTGFTPGSGTAGQDVVITGVNFTDTPSTAVKFGGTNAASFIVDTSTQITAVVGTGATGTISVTTAEGTATSSGTFTFTSSEATLSALTSTAGTLDPTFDLGTLSYSASVSNATTSVTVTPTVSDVHSTIQVRVNGGSYAAVVSGSPSGSLNLNVGSNSINVFVTAQDGVTTNTYTVTVSREGVSTNSDLSTLALSAGTLAPSFDPYHFVYTASVGNATTSITVTPALEESHATVTVNGTPVTSGTPSGSIELAVGSNTITVVVTAEDGISTDTYTVTVTRSASDGTPSALSNLIISAGTLAPSFVSGTFTYAASVDNGITSITVTPSVEESHATVTVNGTPVTSGAPSGSIALAVGSNTITVIVTEPDGVTTAIYTVTVTRNPASTASDLSSLALSAGTPAPTFASHVLTYTASVENRITSITLIPTVAESHATVTVNGSTVASGIASSPVALAVGSNTITIIVTAENGIDSHTYTVKVTRNPASTASDLASLLLSAGTLEPAFASHVITYATMVNNETTSITLTPTVAESTSTIKVNGFTVSSGSPSALIDLSVGENTIDVSVTAQDGVTFRTYSIIVTRMAPRRVVVIVIPPIATIEKPLARIIKADEVGNSQIDATIGMLSGIPAIVSVTLPSGAVSRDVTITITPAVTASQAISGGVTIRITATDATGKQVTHFDKPLSISLGHVAANAIPMFSEDGSIWTPIQLMSGTILADGVEEGYYVEPNGYTIILTRHLTFFGVKKTQQSLSLSASGDTLMTLGHERVIVSGGSGAGVTGFTSTTPGVCSVTDAGFLRSLSRSFSRVGLIREVSAGTCTIMATKSGDGVYLSTSSEPTSFTIKKINQTKLLLTSERSSITIGESIAVAVSRGRGKGDKTFTSTAPTICSVTSIGWVTGLSAGTCTIVATKSGDAVYLPISSEPLLLAVRKTP